MARRRAVVTGGAGFIGSHLVDELARRGTPEIVVVDNLSRGRLSNLAGLTGDDRIQVVIADVRDYPAVRDAVVGADVVYHLAAEATVMGAARKADYAFTTNVGGTYNVLKAAAEANVRRVIFASSREVYGEPVALPVNESHPLMAINTYGATKIASEALCRAFAHERRLDTAILRIANAYGPRDFGRVIPHWIEQVRAGKDLVVFGGEQIIDFIWVGDVVAAMLRAAQTEMRLPPINIANGTGTKIADLARRIAQLIGSAPRVRTHPHRNGEVVRFIGDPKRMSELLGLAPEADPLSRLGALVQPFAGAAA